MEQKENSETPTSARTSPVLTRRDPRRRLDIILVVKAEVHDFNKQSRSEVISAVPERGTLTVPLRPLEATPLEPVAGPSRSRPHITDICEPRSDSTTEAHKQSNTPPSAIAIQLIQPYDAVYLNPALRNEEPNTDPLRSADEGEGEEHFTIDFLRCRFCSEGEHKGKLVNVCKCDDDTRLAHRGCLQKAIKTNNSVQCDSCLYQFRIPLNVEHIDNPTPLDIKLLNFIKKNNLLYRCMDFTLVTLLVVGTVFLIMKFV